MLTATLAVAQSSFEESNSLQSKAKVQLFPNPAIEYLHVIVEGVDVGNLSLVVRNIIGNDIPVEVELLNTNEFRVRVKEFSTGYYLLAMRDEASNFKGTYKFIKR
jgi:Secretion system C-terminal sorting domain